MGKEEDKNKIDKSKCNHGIGGSCLNCIPVSLKENSLKKVTIPPTESVLIAFVQNL